ncbi:hypothetical protein DFJ43DRAFT_1009274 [Lentinula guzmanii]|uniref:CxC1-like cysteine cluster associated with KDZ transposases domain-containing protein n=1 Tax=Lentinula guzmanii TaxID=2804957 RepID=A0AA38MUM6_9AGAR|nr:hypothetical protein DFJ43DRAFT_1009274 [Lentinula guzmanii]
MSAHQHKRLAQNHRWQTEVLPCLIRPYMSMLRQTDNLRNEAGMLDKACTCLNNPRLLEISIVRFTKLQKLVLSVCACRTAAVQLVEQGLFPCAPVHPTLAVDIHVLDFVTRLFLRIAPNNTAWADSINEFLSSQGYQLQGQDPLRRRFGNALQWYNSLQDLTANFVDQVLSIARNYEEGGSEVSDAEVKTVEIAKGKEARESSEDDDSDVDSGSDQPAKKQLRIDSDQEMNHLSRPSEYLRGRCPLCFGGPSQSAQDFNAIVCIDACFTQKHNKRSHKDPPRQHPRTVFLPESDVKRWEEIVASLRPPKTMPKTAAGGEAREDGYELSLKVPNSVLDACEASFTAADGSREKASTQFFDSTALMAMLCRHDRVLWLVNMTSPGERQHYALALIDQLFKNLPSGFTVGLLYDISCSIHRSCVKWGFLDAYLSRLTFAISVFHAYGHGWACQCVYHPRKCDGFGLSDGEGCERFWHSISKLIAYLRICGHHTRLYTLDSQVQYADRLSLLGIGNWLARKWRNTQTRRLEADTQVISSAKQDRYLREQWKSQLSSQTRPLPRQTKNAGRSAVEEAIRLRKVRDTLRDRVSALEDVLSDINSEDYQVAEVEGKLPDLRGKLAQVQAKLIRQEQLLGVVGQQQYRHLATSPFMALRMNAHALKVRLRNRLTSRKFERDRIERSFRRQQYNDRKVRTQTEDAVKRRDPGIQALARQYNILCHKMEELVRLKRAPRNAIAPQPIPLKELFDLDVDDVIWQDVGLDASGDIENPPAWLTDEDVKSGIKGILLRDRCDEELRRLKHECIALYHWLSEEWQVVNACIEAATNLGRCSDIVSV